MINPSTQSTQTNRTMNYKSNLPHRMALNSMRESVALMLERNGITEPSSMHHRCGMFLDRMKPTLEAFTTTPLPIFDRMAFRQSQEGRDIELARAFRKLWDACEMIDCHMDGHPPHTSPFASQLWGDDRI